LRVYLGDLAVPRTVTDKIKLEKSGVKEKEFETREKK
jgi:hypothetical protein